MVDQEQRKLKPIYDALDSGSYKTAIQTCNKLLKKQPQHEVIRALKALALLRANKAEEAIQLCDEILASKPTDDTVLGIMQHVLKHLDRTPEITTMFEDAFKKQPANEELGAQTFMSHIRVGSWKNAQVIALKLFKTFKQPKYLFWSIMSAVLQAQNAGGVNPGMTDNAPILLNLALRMITSSPIPSYVSPDHFYLHLTILKTLDKLDEAYELIQSERGKRLCETSLVVDELRREIFQAKGACKEEAVLCGERLSKKGDRNWITFLSLIDSTFDVIKLNESQSQTETDPAAPSADTKGTGPSSDAKPTNSEGNGEVDPELTPKPTPHPELPLEPQALIDGLRELFERLAKEDGLKERGGHLASLQLEKRVRIREEGQGNPVPDTLLPLVKQYFSNFSDKNCCFEDLKPYVASLQEGELTSWIAFLKEQADAKDISTNAGLARLINVFKLQRFSKTSARTEAEEQADSAAYLKAYFEALPDLPETELQPADDLAILAANALVSAWVITRKEPYLHQALVVLEYASSKSKQNYQFRVLAVRVYRLLAANAPAVSHYRTMDVKQVQTDTLSHLILARGSTYSLAPVGDVGMTQECIAASDIYNQNSSDTADMILKAFQFEKYSQITEFVEFEDRLDNSLQRDLTRLEYVRMKFTTEKLEPEALLLELQELEFVLEKMHHDNRDFAVVPNYQPRGQSLADQTSMGVVRGFQWLTVFLQLYIRAYARACRVETSVASDMNTFLSGWLSEMTEDEKTFLKFSQILHQWIPCPPLQSREAAMAALTGAAVASDATAAPTQNGSGDAAAKTNGDQERKQSPPPPHVKQDGSAPVTVEASTETAVKYFEDTAARAKALADQGELLWEVCHVATLAQEAFVLLQIVSLPYTSKSGKSKIKITDSGSVVESLKTVRTQAATHLRAISTLLTDIAEKEGASERQDEWAAGCAALAEVDAALGTEFAGSVAKKTLEARKTVCEDMDGRFRNIPRLDNADIAKALSADLLMEFVDSVEDVTGFGQAVEGIAKLPPPQDLQRPKPLTTQMIRSVGLGLFFCFAAFVLLIFATVSGPVWGSVSFLNTNIDGREIHFGVFGYTGGPRRLGYTIDQLDTRNGLLNSVVVHKLTYVLVLHPIAAGFAFIAVAFGLCGDVGAIIMMVAAALTTTITLVVWIIDMVLFGITRNKLRDQGHPAQYGNANWLVLGALIALLLGTCTSCVGVFKSLAKRDHRETRLEK